MMTNFTLSHLIQWFTTAQHWTGADGIPHRLLEHVLVSVASVVAAIVVALPIGLFVGHRRKGEFLAISAANVGRAVPSFALLVLVFALMTRFAPSIAFGYGPTFVALALLGIPPILTNAIVGVQGVDPDTVESARGMGMRERDVLLQLEVPLASPLIMGGIRTASLQVVATATLMAVVGGGGLGTYILNGIAQEDTVMMVAGAALVAVLALVTELGLGFLERAVAPKNERSQRRRRPQPAEAVQSLSA
jgi:osmoprotectant transport system permease protein